MLKFLATTDITRKTHQKTRERIKENLLKKTIVKLLFAVLLELSDESRAILFLIGRRSCRKSERKTIDCTRVNLEWKDGQLKLPNGPDRKTYSSVKTYSFKTS